MITVVGQDTTPEKAVQDQARPLLVQLVQAFANELGISLTPKPNDQNVCQYSMSDKNEIYTLDHTITIEEGRYQVIVEKIRIGRKGTDIKHEETWSVNAVTLPNTQPEFSIGYHGLRANAERHKQRIQQMMEQMMNDQKVPFTLYRAMLSELLLVTYPDFLRTEQRARGNLPPNECINVDLDDVSVEELGFLPRVIKEFYS